MIRPTSSVTKLARRNIGFFKSWSCCEKKPECSRENDPPQKYVVQKSCCPSIFETWKPKVPELTPGNYPTIQDSMMAQFKHESCAAGMKFRDQTRCEIQAAAKEREKMNHPKWITSCPTRPKYKPPVDGPLPPLKAAVVQCKDTKGKASAKKPAKKSMRKKCDAPIPEGDWNPDAYIN